MEEKYKPDLQQIEEEEFDNDDNDAPIQPPTPIIIGKLELSDDDYE